MEGINVWELICLEKCDCGGIIQEIKIGDHKLLQCDKCGKYHVGNCD